VSTVANHRLFADEMTDEQTDEWLPVPDAALRLGISESAVRSRVGRRTLRARKGNHGSLVVFVGEVSVKRRSFVGEASPPTSEPRQTLQDGSEVVPLSLHREIVEALQAASGEAVAALQNQIDQLRTNVAEQAIQHRTDLATERQRHEAEIERLVGQIHAERSFWIERADRAEVVAEQAMARADELVRRMADLVDQVARQPGQKPQRRAWWRRWFGGG